MPHFRPVAFMAATHFLASASLPALPSCHALHCTPGLLASSGSMSSQRWLTGIFLSSIAARNSLICVVMDLQATPVGWDPVPKRVVSACVVCVCVWVWIW